MRCVGKTRKGRQCRWPSDRLVGGLGVCEYHVTYARRLWDEVQDRLPADVRLAAERDTRERNFLNQERDNKC